MGHLSEKRFGMITGSECHVLFPKRSAKVGVTTYAKKLAKEIVFGWRDEVNTWQMDHGHMGESVAREWFMKYLDPKCYQPDFIQSGNFGGSGDLITTLGYGVDFKCPTSLEKWLEYLTDGISNQQYCQAQMYMHLYGFKKWKVCAFLQETNFMSDNGLIYPIDEKYRCIEIEVEKDDEWSGMLEERSIDLIRQRDEFVEVYKKIGGTNKR